MLANPLEHLRAGRASGWAVGGFEAEAQEESTEVGVAKKSAL